MTIAEYITLTGLTVTNEDLTEAQILRSRRILEDMLGYTLDPEAVEDNHYTEIGKTSQECPCPDVDMDSLQDPDAVVGAYRLFNYNRKEKTISIDPASEIHKVKLVKDGVTFRTFEADEYRKHFKHGFIKYIEECEDCCWCTCDLGCYCTQLAVDADWLWPDDLPFDLQLVWADLVTWFSDPKSGIKSETLGPHSYTKFSGNQGEGFHQSFPQDLSYNMSIIQKYVGANGSARRILTV